MKTTYDSKADAIYITFFDIRPKNVRAVTREIEPGIFLDFVKGAPVGMEILDVSARLTPAQLKAVRDQHPSPRVDLTMAQAVKESGLAAPTIRAQIANGRIIATKRGRDWVISLTALVNYLESRDNRGRPATLKRARRKSAA